LYSNTEKEKSKSETNGMSNLWKMLQRDGSMPGWQSNVAGARAYVVL
jgi:hypothetical protein